MASEKRKELCRREGYWSRAGDKHLKYLPEPIPPSKPWKGQKRFLKALLTLQAKLLIEKRVEYFNGSTEYEYGGWQWPHGYAHYIHAHNVRLSLAFQEFVLGMQVHQVDEAD